jgi:N-acetyl-1-D-myo-inositol-2-amino-2-deoxy-alpha-D-glucopyranoside deacetylase
MITRVLTLILAFVTGAGMGFVLTFTHRQYVVDWGDLRVPLGLVGGLAIVTALLAGIRLAFGDRLAALLAAAGFLLAAVALIVPARGGSALVLEDPISYTWAIAPTVIAAVVVGWPARRRPAGTASDGSRAG